MLQNARVTAFTVSELLRKNQQGGRGGELPPIQIRFKTLKKHRKATGLDFTSLKVIKFASNVIDSHLYNIVIKDLEKSKYSEEPKTALV